MTDPHYANVALLLPMSGANNGTIFTDYSPTPKTVTRYGDAKTVSDRSKYYGSSGYFDGSGDYLSVLRAGISAFNALTPFTVDAYVFIPSAHKAGVSAIASTRQSAGGIQIQLTDGKPRAVLFNSVGSAYLGVLAASAITVGAWVHLAVVFDGTNLIVFADGVEVARSSTTSGAFAAGTANFLVGRDATTPSYDFIGYLQDLRITAIARYAANFTPPARLIGAVSGIVTDRNGAPCKRKVYSVSRPTDATAPQILAHGLSDPTTGAYELIVPSGEEVTRVVVSEDDDTLLNDLVDRVIPA